MVDVTPETATTGRGTTNLAVALLVHYVLGLCWLFALGGIAGGLLGIVSSATHSAQVVFGVVWALCAMPLWFVDSTRMMRARGEPGRVWRLTVVWWLKSFLAPLALAVEVTDWRHSMAEAEPVRETPRAQPNLSPQAIDDLARRLAALEQDVADLRRRVETGAAAPAPPAPAAVPRHVARPPEPAQRPRPARPRPAPAPTPPPGRSWLTPAVLFSAKSLAWIGGVVTLLGIVFFFVLAVNRGWIGPTARVSLGAIASSLVFTGGLYVRRRFGPIYSAYGAVGAGIAGGFATLLAATLLYQLVSTWTALLMAAAIAGIAVATSLAWSSELVAGLGLVGAILTPAAVGLQDGRLTSAGTAFAALAFAGTGVIAIARRWRPLLAFGVAASLPQAAVLVAQTEPTDWAVVAVAGAFWLLYLAAAIALQRRLESDGLAPLPVSLVLIGASFAGLAAAASFTGSGQGFALVAVASTYGIVAAGLFRRECDRDLSALLGAIGLAVWAFAVADLLSGPVLTLAWAADAALLAWLARRIGEIRYQLASLAYLAAALVHALAVDAPLRGLYRPDPHPASGAVALVGIAIAGGLVAYLCRPWPSARAATGILAPLEPALESFRGSQALWRSVTGWTAVLAALYAASLGVLGIAQWIGAEVDRSFEWGHVAVAALWGLSALAVLYAGLRRSWSQLRVSGLIWLGATLVQAAWFYPGWLSGRPRAFGFVIVAVALLAGALLDRLRRVDPRIFPAIAIFAVSSLGFSVAATVLLVSSRTVEGLALLALSGLYCGIGAAVFRRDRDLSTVLWAPALVVACIALAEVLSGAWLVLAWTVTAAAVAAIADRTADRRLQLPALAYAVLAILHAASLDAPPSAFFEAGRRPAAGVPALVAVVASAALLAALARTRRRPRRSDALDRYLQQRQPLLRRSGFGVAAVLAVYAVSLAILGLAETVGTGSVAARFHSGHAAVSAVWGLLGVVALYAGLRRRLGWLKAVGFGLFAVSLAKIFLYDLTFLSSVTRALSFLAVGAVLLLGGFFVQRLGGPHTAAKPS